LTKLPLWVWWSTFLEHSVYTTPFDRERQTCAESRRIASLIHCTESKTEKRTKKN